MLIYGTADMSNKIAKKYTINQKYVKGAANIRKMINQDEQLLNEER
jgi:hypothetical protein